MQFEVVRLTPHECQGVAEAVTVATRAASANTERMLVVVCW